MVWQFRSQSGKNLIEVTWISDLPLCGQTAFQTSKACRDNRFGFNFSQQQTGWLIFAAVLKMLMLEQSTGRFSCKNAIETNENCLRAHSGQHPDGVCLKGLVQVSEVYYHTSFESQSRDPQSWGYNIISYHSAKRSMRLSSCEKKLLSEEESLSLEEASLCQRWTLH